MVLLIFPFLGGQLIGYAVIQIKMKVRNARIEDREIWLLYRSKLWPNSSDSHLSEIDEYFSGSSIDIEQTFILEDKDNSIVGFLEINIREFAEGSRHSKVPYVEAWYIDEKYQGKGGGKLLMKAAEMWALEKGFNELASDTELNNARSIEIHKHLGFKEVERVVCFIKKIGSVQTDSATEPTE